MAGGLITMNSIEDHSRKTLEEALAVCPRCGQSYNRSMWQFLTLKGHGVCDSNSDLEYRDCTCLNTISAHVKPGEDSLGKDRK